ncbi:hypothetical protein DFP72DRAFT_1162400 [Ephemerocybe angulata]|uniref:Uncharacterized protein n=1 Tax=Ephemerocybe angulata TaxID=980116 RepID=A0A8H6IJH7_9AGAR|nr:hypothetical protein DFP72DRAFT_1162400 [Tulosesus angulatus]
MATKIAIPIAPLPVTNRRSLTDADTRLVGAFQTSASWIWTFEDNPRVTNSAEFEQRAFRKTYTAPKSRGTPSNVTIVIAADDFYAMYIDGAQVQAADPTHDWRAIVAYSVPLPALDGDDNTSFVLAIRVGNNAGSAGLRVIAQVNYPDASPSDIFYTGEDGTWLGERAFQEHWEQPWFEPTSTESNWRPAVLYPSSAHDPGALNMWQKEVVELGRLGAGNGTLGCQDGGGKGKIDLSKGGFAGALVGSIILALALGALGAWLVMRKKVQEARSSSNNSEPAAVSYTSQAYQPPAPTFYQAPSTATSTQPGNTPSVPYSQSS